MIEEHAPLYLLCSNNAVAHRRANKTTRVMKGKGDFTLATEILRLNLRLFKDYCDM